MAIIAKGNSGDFTPAPEGLWLGVCIDVVDKGMVESKQYKPRHVVQIRWVIDAEPKLATGKPHMCTRDFGLSLGDKSKLRPFLEAWRGKKFTTAELDGFDVEKLIGVCGQVQIIHNTTAEGKTYGNVAAVVPYPKMIDKMTVPADYIRECARETLKPEVEHQEWNPEPVDITDDDLPF